MLRCMVYLSTATHLMPEPELLELLEEARSKNADIGVTGMLLYSDGNFIQAIEGESVAVGNLYNKIGRDSRHYGVQTLVDEEITERSFGDWNMGFYSASRAQLAALPGYSQFMNPEAKISDILGDTDALEMLRVFKEHN